ncbi:hypothetical protein [Nisaea sediminum]|uniref:hypothetical protein n=1 Tax=Nisaea sediminum TaxID=2775867 RepID=UPI001866FE0F|nr:hypothetical protein [Nisaea sediminum]
MSSRDLYNNVKALGAISPQEIGSNGAVNGAIIDTAGFESLLFSIASGAVTDGAFTPSMTEGDESDLSDGTAVAAGDMLGTVAGATFADTDDNAVKKVGYRGNKRYVRLTLTAAGVTNGGFFAATAHLGHPRNAPVA